MFREIFKNFINNLFRRERINYNVKENYNNNINQSNLIYAFAKCFNYMIEKIKEHVSELYGIPIGDLNKVSIYFVDNLPSYFPESITYGLYESLKDRFGRIYKASIYIPKWLLYYPKLFIETLAHELTHLAQDLKGKLKNRFYRNFEEYFYSEEEKEARYVGKIVRKRLYDFADFLEKALYNIYGPPRVHFL